MKYDLLPSGKCPKCKKTLKVETDDYIGYKSKPVIIYKLEGKVETKCPKCKELIVDKR